MKNSKAMSMHILIIFLSSLFLFSACQEDTSNSPEPVDNFESDEYAILDFDDAMNTVEGGTIESEFSVGEPFPGDNNFQRHPNHPNRRGSHLRQILWLLELSDDQKELVHTYVRESHECGRTAFTEFRAIVGPILESANEERKGLIEQYRNGEITNEELYNSLKELRESTHQLIESDPEVQSAKQMICDCKLSLLENVESILSDDQLAIWNDWVGNIQGPCFE